MCCNKLVLFTLFFLTPLSAYADEASRDNVGWFVGGAIGSVAVKIETKNSSSQDGVSQSYAAYGGYNFTEWFGLEGMIMRTGDVSDDKQNLVSANITSLSIMPKFRVQINQLFSLYGKAGFAWLKYEEEYDNYVFRRGYNESWSDVAIQVGVGGEFHTNVGVAIRISYDYLKGSLEGDDNVFYRTMVPNVDASVDQLSLGVHYQF